MISRAGMGAAGLLCESRAPAHGLIARMITATARAIQKTSANLVALGPCPPPDANLASLCAAADFRAETGRAL
jgi:hypothetical protein